jgi:hypothetical protein
MLSPQPSTAIVRPKRFTDAAPGDHSNPLSLQNRIGLFALITGACWSLLKTFRRPKPRRTAMPPWTITFWQHNLKNQPPEILGRFKTTIFILVELYILGIGQNN